MTTSDERAQLVKYLRGLIAAVAPGFRVSLNAIAANELADALEASERHREQLLAAAELQDELFAHERAQKQRLIDAVHAALTVIDGNDPRPIERLRTTLKELAEQ